MLSSAAKTHPCLSSKPEGRSFSALFFATTAGAGLIRALFVKPVRRLMSGVH